MNISDFKPLEKIWRMGLLRLKFQLCQPKDPFAFFCQQVGLNYEEITEEGTALLSAWLLSKEKDWKKVKGTPKKKSE